MIGAVERRMEMGGKMPLPDTFRVGSIMTTAYIMPEGDKSTLPEWAVNDVPRAYHRAFISPLWVGDVGEWRLGPTGERRLAACPRGSE